MGWSRPRPRPRGAAVEGHETRGASKGRRRGAAVRVEVVVCDGMRGGVARIVGGRGGAVEGRCGVVLVVGGQGGVGVLVVGGRGGVGGRVVVGRDGDDGGVVGSGHHGSGRDLFVRVWSLDHKQLSFLGSQGYPLKRGKKESREAEKGIKKEKRRGGGGRRRDDKSSSLGVTRVSFKRGKQEIKR